MNIEVRHVELLEHQGNQGVVGKAEIDGVLYIYKIPRFMDRLTIHEHEIIKSLDPYPHFCKGYQLIWMPVHPEYIKKDHENPFEPSKYSLSLPVLFMEYIEGTPITTLVYHKVKLNTTLAMIKQSLLAILYGQRYTKLTHYDLHTDNILAVTTDPDQVNLYLLKDSIYMIPTYGYESKIIDFGFSRSDAMIGKRCYTALAHTETGHMAPVYDPLYDARVLLVSYLDCIKNGGRISPDQVKLKNTIMNMFKHTRVDWESGWDRKNEETDTPLLYSITERLDTREQCEFFAKYSDSCMDTLQSLIRLPIKPKGTGDMDTLQLAFDAIQLELKYIEQDIRHPYYSFYVFSHLIDYISEIEELYQSSPKEAVQKLETRVFSIVQQVAKYCKLKNVDYDILLCSIITFKEHLEYFIHVELTEVVERKITTWSSMEFQSLESIYALLDLNFSSEYTFTDKTVVKVYDPSSPQETVFTLPKRVIDKLNDTPITSRPYVLKYCYDSIRIKNEETNSS